MVRPRKTGTKNPSLRADEGTVPDRQAWEPISVRAEKKASAFGRSPGSWIANRASDSPPSSPFPACVVEWVVRTASTYSGGTAPASNRLPFYARVGTEGTYSIFRELR